MQIRSGRTSVCWPLTGIGCRWARQKGPRWRTHAHRHKGTNKNTNSQKYTHTLNPTMCLVSHQGTCCQSDGYVRLSKWKQSRNKQYGYKTGSILCVTHMCAYVPTLMVVWLSSRMQSHKNASWGLAFVSAHCTLRWATFDKNLFLDTYPGKKKKKKKRLIAHDMLRKEIINVLGSSASVTTEPCEEIICETN